MLDKNQLLEDLCSSIEKHSATVIQLSDYLTDHPEISGSEKNSSKKIIDLLNEYNIPVEAPFCGLEYAFKANICHHLKPVLRIALLAEYDALPEIGHACGHSASGSISVLSALVLRQYNQELPIVVDLIGSPDEEVIGSKTIMAEKGVFDSYDIAIMIHMSPKNSIAFRTLAVKDLEITFHGQTSHAAASPWEGKNALNGLQLFYHAVDMLRQHVKPDVRMHGVIKEGGHVANIVPDLAKAHFFIRSNTNESLNEVIQKVEDCAKGASIATQTQVVTQPLYPPYYEIIPNHVGEEAIANIYENIGLTVEPIEYPSGSTDMGNVSYRCPVFHPMLSISDQLLSLHTKEFAEALKSNQAHKSIINGSKIIIFFLVELLTKENLLEEVRQEHHDRLMKLNLNYS